MNDNYSIIDKDAGIAILKNNHDALLKTYANNLTALETIGEFKIPEVDENGYTEMKLWEVMETFGNYVGHGTVDVPFETTIAISEEYLTDQEKE